MNPRKRYGSKNTDQGVYLGLSKTQVLSPATAGNSSSDIAPLPPQAVLVPPPPDTMSCRDRTQEFLSACKSLQSRQVRIWRREAWQKQTGGRRCPGLRGGCAASLLCKGGLERVVASTRQLGRGGRGTLRQRSGCYCVETPPPPWQLCYSVMQPSGPGWWRNRHLGP